MAFSSFHKRSKEIGVLGSLKENNVLIQQKYPSSTNGLLVKRDFPFVCGVQDLANNGIGKRDLVAISMSNPSSDNKDKHDVIPKDRGNPLLKENNYGSHYIKVASSNYPSQRILEGLSAIRDFPSSSRKRDYGCVKRNVSFDNIKQDFGINSYQEMCSTFEDHVAMDGKSNLGLQLEDSSSTNQDIDDSDARCKVKMILDVFREVLLKVRREIKAKPTMEKADVYKTAGKIFRGRQSFVNVNKHLGVVPGVEVGDEFQCWVELNIIGLHCHHAVGIDYLVKDGIKLATSVVASERYHDKMEGDVLVYVGEGGNKNGTDRKFWIGRVGKKRKMRDQKLVRGNLALKNSMEQRTPVRVIHREVRSKGCIPIYKYDGLYIVEKYWKKRGEFGNIVFQFKLRRVPREGNLFKGVSTMSVETKFNNGGLCMSDKRLMFGGCNCANGCLKEKYCSCKENNGGEIPYNVDQCLVRRTPIVYECGPLCKCGASCINRVSQRDTQVKLDVFKHKSNRWGVRSRYPIPFGSFICELKVNEGKKGDEDLTIEQARFGDEGRFIYHSSLPNLFACQIFYNGLGNMPRIMLFTKRHIPPLHELTFDYNLHKISACSYK